MRSALASCALLSLALAAAASAAQRQYTLTWTRLAPDDEEFAVLMPAPNWRIRRELSFGRGATLLPASFEIASRGAFFSVLSFSRSGSSTPKTLDAFVEGFRRALAGNTWNATASLEFERAVTLDGHTGRQFRLKVGDATGAARVFETRSHFYVVFTLKRAGGDELVTRFNESFTLDKSAAPRVSDRQALDDSPQTPPAPGPLWPVAGLKSVVGAKGSGARAPGTVSGGVMNGKILRRVPPAYPPIAKAARAQGTVVVQITVDEEGYVISSTPISGHPLLQQAAAASLRQWRFTPTVLSGQPVKVSGVVTVSFSLN